MKIAQLAIWAAQRCQLRAGGRPGLAALQPSVRRAWYSSAVGDSYESKVDALNDKFAEARDEIEYAQEDAETTYFNESAETARAAVKETLDQYNQLLGALSENDRGRLQRSMGLKMEQLKAEVAMLDTLHT